MAVEVLVVVLHTGHRSYTDHGYSAKKVCEAVAAQKNQRVALRTAVTCIYLQRGSTTTPGAS